MAQNDQSFYRIDDILLRVGVVGLLLVLAAGGIGLLYVQAAAEDQTLPPGYAWSMVGRHTLAYLGVLACPLVALRVGWKIRRREKRIRAIWRLLQRHAHVSVDELIENSHFTPADVDAAVKLINTRGLGHYVWDRSANTIQDARLRESQLHVEKCEVCGGSVSLEVPIGFSHVPTCPYCGDPVSADALEDRRREVIERLQAEHAPNRDFDISAVPFSVPVFLVLMLVAWPMALAYAWWKCSSTRGEPIRFGGGPR